MWTNEYFYFFLTLNINYKLLLLLLIINYNKNFDEKRQKLRQTNGSTFGAKNNNREKVENETIQKKKEKSYKTNF